jgi:hypothetical protein
MINSFLSLRLLKDREFVELDVPCGSGLGTEIDKVQTPISPSLSLAVTQGTKSNKCWISSCCSKRKKRLKVRRANLNLIELVHAL